MPGWAAAHFVPRRVVLVHGDQTPLTSADRCPTAAGQITLADSQKLLNPAAGGPITERLCKATAL